MCRFAAYLGPRIRLEDFLCRPSHSLLQQSWAPREMHEARLNADGYGFGWYGAARRPLVYLSTRPIWNDCNLESLGRGLRSTLWLANVRSATSGQPVTESNTQPFRNGSLMYLHNGCLQAFGSGMAGELLELLPPERRGEVAGSTDSEYIFALLREQWRRHRDFPGALRAVCAQLHHFLGRRKGLLNLLLSDGRSVCALRHAVNDRCPSLYYSERDPGYPGALLVASEKLTRARGWRTLPPHSLLLARHGHPLLLEKL